MKISGNDAMKKNFLPLRRELVAYRNFLHDKVKQKIYYDDYPLRMSVGGDPKFYVGMNELGEDVLSEGAGLVKNLMELAEDIPSPTVLEVWKLRDLFQEIDNAAGMGSRSSSPMGYLHPIDESS